jgi:hypothetical protein
VGVELRAPCLLGRDSTTWSMMPALFALVILGIGSHIYAWVHVDCNSPTLCFLHRLDDRSAPSHLAIGFSGVLWTFFQGWSQTYYAPYLQFWVVRITGMSPATIFPLNKLKYWGSMVTWFPNCQQLDPSLVPSLSWVKDCEPSSHLDCLRDGTGCFEHNGHLEVFTTAWCWSTTPDPDGNIQPLLFQTA